MSINRPRRIFRSEFPRLDAKGLVVVLVAGVMAAAGVSLAVLPRREPAPTPPPAEQLSAPPAKVAVVDGGTLRLRDRVVRLQGVEPPPRGSNCGRDGADEDCGAAATNALAALVREAQIVCRITGEDRLGRPYAICTAGGIELNRAVVAAGWARADHARPELQHDEEAARAGHLGVWASAANSDR